MKTEEKNCLVTGGCGFIGSHLVDQLLAGNCRVRVLDNLTNGKLENLQHHFGKESLEIIQGDITAPLDVEKAMEGIDIVFHLACLGVRHSLFYPYANHRVNAEGTLLLLDAAARAHVDRFIHCSSSEVYGTALYVPMPEAHPTCPCTIYGASKLAGEAYARAYSTSYGLPTVIIRPFNTYGPRSHHEGDAGEMIPKSIVRILAGEDVLIFGDGSQTRDFTYVEDTARGLIAAAEQDSLIGQTLNIGSNFEIAIRDLAERLIEFCDTPKAGITYTSNRPGDVARLFADPGRFMELTGWRPRTDFSSGLQKTISYFRNHPAGIERLHAAEAGRNWTLRA
ncbi:MAG: GDP-mannose 4,6-dehydratase [Desulfobulbaceae bacterium]